jgi:8-oxo-(d)GTP phosphatase
VPQRRVIQAAGAVLWRAGHARDNGVPEVALVHRPRYDDWSLPKGKVDPGEHALVTALREVSEETGYTARLGRPLPSARYVVGGHPKRVRYWAASPLAGEFTPNREVDELAWLPLPAARERLTQPRDVDVLDALVSAPVHTTPLVVLRHATARDRENWTGADLDRPLSEEGLAEARSLPFLLAAFRPSVVLSSPARRCLDTVRPYALAAGFPVRDEPPLSETGFLADPDRVTDWLGRLLSSREPVLLCSHRPVLPALLTSLGVSPSEPRLAPSEFVVVHRTAEQVVAVERHAVPTSP